MPKRKPILSPAVQFAIFDGDKKLTRPQLQEIKAFVSDVEKQKTKQKARTGNRYGLLKWRCLRFPGLPDLTVQGLPGEAGALERHVAAGAVLLGEGDGAGVEIDEILLDALFRHVGVTADEDITCVHGRRVVLTVLVAVGEMDGFSARKR